VATKKAKDRYDLMAMKTGDDLFGNTEVLAVLSLDCLKAIERIAKVLASDRTGVLLDTLKKYMDSWEAPIKTGDQRKLTKQERVAGVQAYDRMMDAQGVPWKLRLILDREGEEVVLATLAQFKKRQEFTPELKRKVVQAVRLATKRQ
jgi:hypothetical protein